MKSLLRYLSDLALRPVIERYFKDSATKDDVNNIYDQISCLLSIRDLLGPTIPLGLLRNWAISPDALLVILRDIQRRTAPMVVEFGGGESTLAIAGMLKSSGSGGRLKTVEHDSRFAERLRDRLESAGLSGVADVQTVEMRDYTKQCGFPEFRSYDLKDFDLGFDVAIVDGPIVGEFGAGTRLVPLRWCTKNLTPGGTIYLDDASRKSERNAIEIIKMSTPNISFENITAEKGLLRIQQCLAVGN